jgi:hypothetical protein
MCALHLSPLPSQRWLRLTFICAEDVHRDAGGYLWRLLDGLDAALCRYIDGPTWLQRAGTKHLSVALQFYGPGEPPGPAVQSFRGWYGIDVPVHLPTTLDLPLDQLIPVVRRHVLDALRSPAVVAALGYPPLHPGHGPSPAQPARYRTSELRTTDY